MTACGQLPAGISVRAAVAVAGGLLVIAVKEVGPHQLQAHVLKASPEGVIARAVLDKTGWYRHMHACRRPEGGAYIVLPGMDATWIYAVADDGTQVGEPWRFFDETRHDWVVAATAWKQGVSLVTLRGNVGAVLFDGKNATYSATGVQGVMVVSDQRAGIASSPDGRTLLVSFFGLPHSKIARFVCESADPAAAYRPTRRIAGPAGAPPVASKPRVMPSPFGTVEQVLRRVRQRQLLAVFTGIRNDYRESDWRGDASDGWYYASDGAGNYVVIGWDAAGLVAYGFDHEHANSEWHVPQEKRNPRQHLPGLPPELAPLAAKTADSVQRLATEGLWIMRGAEPAHGESINDILRSFRKDDREGIWLGGGDGQPGELASRLADSSTATLTAADGEMLLTWAARAGHVLDVAKVEAAVAQLAKLGVSWPGALEAARARAAIEQEQKDARIKPADRELFEAAHEGDLEAAQRALSNGADIDSRMPAEHLPRTPEGVTPLIVAIRRGHIIVANHLIDAGANLELDGSAWGGKVYPLRVAAERGDVTLCKKLLDRGASVRPNVSSWGILQQIVHCRDGRPGQPADYAQIIELLLDAGAPLPNQAHCRSLARMAEEGGAPHLIPRLSRK